MPITSDLDRVRLAIGDTDVDPDADALFSDEEIEVYISNFSTIESSGGTLVDINGAAAALCGVLATRFAREFDFAEDGQSFSLSQRSSAYAARANELRERSWSGGMGSIPLITSDSWETA